ncbi:pentatricopeptide repeat-containing protein At5g39710-like [Prunus persica]|uniref:pentatricopeptide repeat-containing protein At5g39710-like n=1 Tax=Prunus persica TaxID=3760 RepID=UPI0009ABA865|nr:pentatricopeptide repeat-containing protein At5g39710-like [Prunus persica]
MSGSKVLLTYKRKRQSRTDPVQVHECRISLFVAPDDTSLSKPPDLKVHLIDKRSSENYNRNYATRVANTMLFHIRFERVQFRIILYTFKLQRPTFHLAAASAPTYNADFLTYNALILGLCKEGKTKKAAYLVKELDRKRFVPNAATFSALIEGQCVRKNSDRAFELCKSMIRSGYHPDEHTFKMLISSFCNNRDFDGAVEVLK